MVEISSRILARPVHRRQMYRRWIGEPPPPTEAEKHDAILLLRDDWRDAVGDEAFRILDEYGR